MQPFQKNLRGQAGEHCNFLMSSGGHRLERNPRASESAITKPPIARMTHTQLKCKFILRVRSLKVICLYKSGPKITPKILNLVKCS